MSFAANPLALSNPDPAFDSWLRDSGYLEILDSHTSSSSAAATCPPSTTATCPPSSNPSRANLPPKPFNPAQLFIPVFRLIKTLISLLTLNPFARLAADDFAGPTPTWTYGFVGSADSYSIPAGPSQARMRVQENVKRYARNYACLSLIFLACSLYQMPVPLLGVVVSLGLWEFVRYCGEKWEMEEKCPILRQVLVRTMQIATLMILYACKLQVAFICATSVSYTVMILHASLRKLAPPKQSTGPSRHKQR